MPTRRPRRSLLVLLALPWLAVARVWSGDGADLALRLAPDQCVGYSISTIQDSGGKESLVAQPDRTFFFLGRELEEGRRLVLSVRRVEDIPTSTIFRVPPKPLEKGEAWRDEILFEIIPDLAPVRLEIAGKLVAMEKLDDRDCWKIVGEAALPRDAGKPKNAKTKRYAREVTLQWSAWFDPAEKVIRRFRYTFAITQAPVRGDEKETVVKTAEQCQLRETYTPGTKALRDRIIDAINRGVDALKKAQQPDGAWKGLDAVWHEGNTALMLLALIRSGLSAHDPIIEKGFEFVRKQPMRRVYSVALMILALEARYTPPEEIRAAEDYLDHPEAFKSQERRLPDEDRELMERAVAWIEANALNKRSWSYDDPKGRYDNSNTQYAVLGFDAAARCGVKIDPKTWRGIAEHFLQMQNKRGPEVVRKPHLAPGAEKGPQAETTAAHARGWGYYDSGSDSTGNDTYSSMTCAGLTGLMVARVWLNAGKEMDKPLAARIDTGINDGLAWLETHFNARVNAPRYDDWYFYYIYGIERVGVLAGTKYFGERDWYAEGAMILCDLQYAAGGWGRYEYDTAFALLFLKKGTVPILTK